MPPVSYRRIASALYVIILTAIISTILYAISPNFYSYIFGIAAGLFLGFSTEDKLIRE